MKAAYFERYGPPEKVLSIKDIDQPSPKATEVLIRIRATTINDYDWSVTRGKPFIYRLMFGLRTPKMRIPGMELSGIVEAIGEEVSKFKVGDKVFGDCSDFGFGTLAEFICLNEKAVVPMPENMPFEDAAALPHAALLAMQGLKKLGNIQEGQEVLINGGGGGVGSIGLQIAKTFNCRVSGVDAASKLEQMQELGFDEVMDYRKVNFTKTGKQYDLILDCKTSQFAFAYPRALKPNGKYISIGGKVPRLIGLLIWGKLATAFSNKQLKILGLKANQGLEEIAQWYLNGKIKAAIDGPYPLEEAGRLIQYFGEGKHHGKIVIRLTET